MSAQEHQANPNILDRRTLGQDHRILADLLRPGLAVLDVGCGSGAITADIARAVGPHGRAVGLDRDAGLISRARNNYADVGNLSFEEGDACALPWCSEFDVVACARLLQWLDRPGDAIAAMARAAKPGALVAALDYNHVQNQWEPEPPVDFQRFYGNFLDWRARNGWDNEMGNHLPALFESAGLSEIQTFVQDEVAERGEAGFEERSALWGEVIRTLRAPLVNAGFCSAAEIEAATATYEPWRRDKLMKQTLSLRAVVGRVR